MKKSLPVLLATLLLATTSCSLSPDGADDNELTVSQSVTTFNHFVAESSDADGVRAVAILPAVYSLTSKSPAGTMTVQASKMSLPDGEAASFLTNDMAIKAANLVIDQENFTLISFSSENPTASDSQSKLSDLSAYFTKGAYPVPTKFSVLAGSAPQNDEYLLMNYQLEGTWSVSTFWPDMTFRCTTTTEYPGMEEAYVNDGFSYRVMMGTDSKGGLTGKCSVVMYNARFAPQMPITMNIVLQDLDVKPTSKGFEIFGENVVPQWVEADGMTPVERFTFDSYRMFCNRNMTSAEGNYTVAGKYQGSFSGKSFPIE